MRVLVVDDDEAARLLTLSILKSGGHETVWASDGVGALEAAGAERPDVLLTDILMPRMDGYQLVRAWKAEPSLATVPVVFLTASYTDPADVRFALDLGAERFLTKPVEPEVLLEVVREIGEQGGSRAPERPPRIGEREVLREYSERLVNKLEEKVLDLQRANAMLRRTTDVLSDELGVKAVLIEELGGRVDAEAGERMRAHDLLGRALDGTEIAVVVVERGGIVRYLGPGAERMTGFSSSEVAGRDFCETLVPVEDRDRRRAGLRSLEDRCDVSRTRTELLTASGRRLPVEWIETVWRDADGDVRGVVALGLPCA